MGLEARRRRAWDARRQSRLGRRAQRGFELAAQRPVLTVDIARRKLPVMPCHACGAELLAGKEFCHQCGEPVQRRCASCGAVLQGQFRFCPDCGAAVNGAPAPSATAPRAAGAESAAGNGNGNGESLRRFASAMPAKMAEQISATGASMRGERKVVTVLFCDLAGSTAVAEKLDAEEYRELLDEYLKIAFREIYRFEGIVNQIAGDGLMALFGAPIAHEDDPQRAIWAALAIRDAMVGFNATLRRERGIELPARIGINTGPVVAGAVGNDLKMDYTAIGDTTNLAARLESLAKPGTVLVSDETERLTRAFFRTQAVGPLRVKGKSEAIPAFEVVEAIEAADPMAVAARRGLTPLVGRAQELQQMRGCFERLRGGLPQLVHLLGDAGSGKSRLIYEFRQSLAPEDATFLEARCSALHQLEPYYPFIHMLRLYFQIDSRESHEVIDARVEEKTGAALSVIERDFPHLCRLLSMSGLDSNEIPSDELRQEVTGALGHLLHRESRRAPVVVVFEDLQWADEQSRELLSFALSKVRHEGAMVIVSSRPDEFFAWHTRAAVTQIYLRPLSDEATTGIMRSIIGGPLPADLEARIRERAEGSPFFVEEITRSLVERGLLRCGPGGCEPVGNLADLTIPGSVREVLAARLDSLDPAAKRVVQLAAVLGRQFRRDELEELSDDGLEVRVAIEKLIERGVVHATAGLRVEEFRFGESLTQEVAYESLLLKERRALHERVAVMLEVRGGRPSLVAHHYARSDNVSKAVETLLAAARDAEHLPAYRSAHDLYRRAWEIAEASAPGGDPEAQRRLVQAALGYCRVAVLYGSSEDPLARRAAELAVDAAGVLGDGSALASATTYLGMIMTTAPSEFAQGLQYVEAGVQAARGAGDETLAISTSRALAWNYLLDGRFEQSLETLDWAMERLRAMGEAEKPSDIYLSARMMRQQVLFFADDLDAALAEAMETEQLAQRVNNRTIGSGSRGLISYAHFVRGDYEEARRSAEQSLAIAEEIGVEWGMRRASILAVAAHVEIEGTPPEPRLMELAEEGASMGGNMVLTVLPLVEALLALLKFRRAESIARQSLDKAAGRLRLMYSKVAVGDALLRLGESRWAESESSFREALRLGEEIGSIVGQAASLNGLGKIAFVRGDREAAAAHFERAAQISRASGIGRYAARAERLLQEARDVAGASAPAA
jgi:class 3 adenylate cyclase/tetratricopeptide (TPR) repeat protein/predicted RNA-binding Zn-ribbon protein involved in translation (DUF1610 family)